MRKIDITTENIDGLTNHQTAQIIHWVERKDNFAIVFDFDTIIEYLYDNGEWSTYVKIKNILITNSPLGIPDNIFMTTPEGLGDHYIILGDFDFRVME